jgi:hypothetical protein
MRITSITYLALFIAMIIEPCDLAAQSSVVSLPQISEQVQGYMQRSRGWKHETADPPTPPGSRPSADVAIHFWSSEKCLSAELRIDGRKYETQSVPCRFKLAIDQSSSTMTARNRLSEFVLSSREGNFTPVSVGDKGYVWNGSTIVFIKGRFTFWLSGGADLTLGDFSINREFIEKLAHDIAGSVTAS